MSASDLLASFFCVVSLLVAVWMCWVYLLTFKDNQSLRRDNYRLMRRLGRYHSLSLGPNEGDDPLPVPFPREPALHPFFRNRRPTPPITTTPPKRG